VLALAVRRQQRDFIGRPLLPTTTYAFRAAGVCALLLALGLLVASAGCGLMFSGHATLTAGIVCCALLYLRERMPTQSSVDNAAPSIVARAAAVVARSQMSVAFTKEDSAETASETLLPDRPISSHPNLVTEAGLKALERQLDEARKAYEAAQAIDDVNERRRQSANPLRDARYFAERVRTAQVIPSPSSSAVVAFGSTVTFSRDDGRVQKYRIVGEDEADPKLGSVSFVSPVARALMGKAVGDVASAGGQELEVIAID
jgi:transcription elongation GreA/GreB family factor